MKKTQSNQTAETEVIETAVYCDGCGDAITDGRTFEHDGEVFCKSCFESEFCKCDGCGEIIKQDEATQAEGGTYCETCLDDSFFMCPDCEEYKSQDDAVTVHCRNNRTRTMTGSTRFLSLRWRTDEKVVCESCAERHYIKCDGCGEIIKQDEATQAEGGTYCETCLDDSFFMCPDCEEYKSQYDAVTVHWRTDEKVVCESCAKRHYIKCADCGSYVPEDQSYYTGHDYSVCFDCYENNYGSCDNCNEIYRSDNLIYSDRRDETFCESCYRVVGCGSIQDYSYKPSPKYRHFNQTTNETVYSRQPGNRLYLGFELEVESLRESPDSVASDLISDYDEPENLFYCKYDSSLDEGFEVVSHPLTLRAHKTRDYEDILKSLKDAGCKSHNTKTCGLHVHVSRSFFTQSEMVKLGLFVYFNKSRLETFARRTESSYAKFKPLNRHNYLESAESHERYEAINFEPYHTIEFRLFRGTLNFETFIATLEFCDAVSRFVKTVSACQIAKDGGFDLFKVFVKKDGNRKLYKNLSAYLDSKGL